MGRFKGRSTVACVFCHKQKLKCSGESPCRRCQARGLRCTYPAKDRVVAVIESHLLRLESEAASARGVHLGIGMAVPDATQHMVHRQTPLSSPPAARRDERSEVPPDQTDRQLLEDCSAEHFVQKLRELSLATSPDHAGIGLPSPFTPAPHSSNYTYSRLKFDVLKLEVSFRLPPLPYTLHLLDVFEEGYSDYHWMLRKQFRKRLLQTYANPPSQAHDKAWLCCVSLVLALGETYSSGRARGAASTRRNRSEMGSPAQAGQLYPATDTFGSAYPASDLPPGAELFEQGLRLLRSPSEESRVDDVAALNLAAFYCYSLNRRKTAYLMAGQSIRTAMLLQLHKPWLKKTATTRSSPTTDHGAGRIHDERVEAEHRKRTWWTSYCMDRMVSTEFGFSTAQDSPTTTQSLTPPSNDGLSAAGAEEFFDGQILAAQVQLCRIKVAIAENSTRPIWGGRRPETGTNADGTDPALDAIIRCMDMLRDWQQNLPGGMRFSFDNGVPADVWVSPKGRTLLSLYLRYNQCMVLLIRPLLLQELSSFVSTSSQPRKDQFAQEPGPTEGEKLFFSSPELASLKLECLRAAQCNCRVLVSLWANGMIARYGYWDALHLFSGLAICCLAGILNQPGSATSASPAAVISGGDGVEVGTEGQASRHTPDSKILPNHHYHQQQNLYSQARALLEEMARVGNPAAKDYVVMLEDVEAMVSRVLARRDAAEQAASSSFSHLTVNGGSSSSGLDGEEIGLEASSFAGVPYLDTTEFSFQSMVQGDAWQAMDWDGLLNTWPASLT